MSIMAKVAKRHVVPPATAEEIRRTVGVTKEDARLVRKVMTELGYLSEPSPRSAMARPVRAGKQVPIKGDPVQTTGRGKARSK